MMHPVAGGTVLMPLSENLGLFQPEQTGVFASTMTPKPEVKKDNL
jgi:hypothetical protein